MLLKRINWTGLLAMVALICAIGAAVCFAPIWQGFLWLPALILTVVSWLTIATLVWQQSTSDAIVTVQEQQSAHQSLTRRDWYIAGCGVILLSVVTGLQFVPQVPEILQVVLLFMGMVTLTWGLGSVRRQHFSNLVQSWQHTPRWVWYSLGATFAGAIMIRLWRLEGSLRVLVDEMQNITPVVQMWDANFPVLQQIYYPDYPYTYLYSYLQQMGSAVFGYSLFTLRVPNAIFGALSIFAIYWLVNTLFENRQIAVLSAVSLATLPLHVQFSRIGIMNLYDPTLAMLAFVFAVRGLRYGLRRDWVFAGVMLGFTHYVYEGGRLLHTPLLSLWVFILAFWLWRRVNRMQVARGVAWSLVVSLVIAAPIYMTWLGHGDVVFGRFQSQNLTKIQLPSDYEAQQVADYRTEQIATNFVDSFALYVTKLDEWMFYGGAQPMIPSFLQPFFLLGIAASVASRRRWGYTVLPALWLVVTASLLGLFIWNPLHAARHTVAMPAMAIVIALGVYWITQLLFQMPNRRITAAWALMLTLGVGQVVYYFGFHLPIYNEQARTIRGYADPDDAMLRASELPHNTEVYLITQRELFPRWQPKNFLIYITHGNIPIVHVWLEEWIWGDMITELTPGRNHAFFIEATNFELMEEIMALHPNLTSQFSDDPRLPANLQFMLLYVPADQVLPRPPQPIEADSVANN